MGIAVISDNTTIKVSAAIGNSRTTTGTLYTAPANAYAIVQISARYDSGSGATAAFTVGGYPIIGANIQPTGAIFNNQGASQVANIVSMADSIMVGPGQILSVTISGSVVTCAVSGVEFINTP